MTDVVALERTDLQSAASRPVSDSSSCHGSVPERHGRRTSPSAAARSLIESGRFTDIA